MVEPSGSACARSAVREEGILRNIRRLEGVLDTTALAPPAHAHLL